MFICLLPDICLKVGCGEIMCAKREGKLTAVMQIVLNHMPDDPLTREFVWPAPALASKDIFQIFRCPALQTLLPGTKCHFQTTNQFGSGRHVAFILPLGDSCDVWTTLSHQVIQPTSTSAYNMPGELANRAEMG